MEALCVLSFEDEEEANSLYLCISLLINSEGCKIVLYVVRKASWYKKFTFAASSNSKWWYDNDEDEDVDDGVVGGGGSLEDEVRVFIEWVAACTLELALVANTMRASTWPPRNILLLDKLLFTLVLFEVLADWYSSSECTSNRLRILLFLFDARLDAFALLLSSNGNASELGEGLLDDVSMSDRDDKEDEDDDDDDDEVIDNDDETDEERDSDFESDICSHDTSGDESCLFKILWRTLKKW